MCWQFDRRRMANGRSWGRRTFSPVGQLESFAVRSSFTSTSTSNWLVLEDDASRGFRFPRLAGVLPGRSTHPQTAAYSLQSLRLSSQLQRFDFDERLEFEFEFSSTRLDSLTLALALTFASTLFQSSARPRTSSTSSIPKESSLHSAVWISSYATANPLRRTVMEMINSEYLCKIGTPIWFVYFLHSNTSSSILNRKCNFHRWSADRNKLYYLSGAILFSRSY